MAGNLELKTAEKNNFAIIIAKGKIDSDTAAQLNATIVNFVKAGKVKIVLDLAAVTFMSSAGIGITVKALNDTRAQKGDFRISSIKEEVKKVYQLLGFAAAFKFYNNLESALQ